MYKKFFILLFIVTCYACNKRQQEQTKCGSKICTTIFASITVQFIDNQGQPASIKDLQLVNLRTNSSYVVGQIPEPCCGFYSVASDSELGNFSTEGDDVQVTATSITTNQTKTFVVKIAGGCACHISKVSGPDKIVFD